VTRLFFLAIGMFAVGSSSFLTAGLLPQIGQTIGQPISIASQGITAFGLTYLASAPLFSMAFANRPAKRILQIALVLFLIGSLITFCSKDIGSFLLGRILAGAGAGIFNPLCVDIAVQVGSRHSKGKILSLVWGANSAGVVFGVPLGIYLSSKFNWQISFIYTFLLGTAALIGFSMQRLELMPPKPLSKRGRLRPLVDKDVLAVLGITCLTSLASLGLYSYVALTQTKSSHPLAVSLFFWGLGGFVGSLSVGFFVDRSKNPRTVMAFTLAGLLLAIALLPFTTDLPYLGLLSLFMWGAFGWATTTPQQHVLFELCESQRTIVSALNSSAIGLGSSLGTAIGGLIIAAGFSVGRLPFFASIVLSGVLIWQLALTRRFQTRSALHE